MSTLSVDTIQGQTVAANVKLPAGCVLQCLQTIKTDTFDSSSNRIYILDYLNNYTKIRN